MLRPSTMFFFASCSCFKHFIYIYIFKYIYIYIYTWMFIFMCVCVVCVCVCVVCVCVRVCVCVFVCVWEGGGVVVVGGWVLCFSRLTPSAVSLSMNGAQQLHQETRMIRGNRERAVFDLFSILKCVRSKGFFGEPLGSSENLTWANFGDRPLLSLPSPSFLLLLSPFVRPKNLRV